MTNHEKSVELLKLIGWHPVVMPKYHSEGWYRLADKNGNWEPWEYAAPTSEGVWGNAPDLYEPKNMALAWQVLNFAAAINPVFSLGFAGFWDNADLWRLPAERAQQMWLDKVLELSQGNHNPIG